MKPLALATAALLLAATAALLVAAPPGRGAVLVNALLEERTGSTAMLGGGDYVFVRFGTDAAFGVLYGNATNPNNVYIVALKARYLGVAQVYDGSGREIASNRPVKIYTLYAAKLDDIVEFKDQTGEGLANYTRTYDGSDFTYYQPQTDNFYKKVSLRTSWSRSPIERSNGTEWRSWRFNVSASNLPYAPVANYSGSLTGPRPTVRFTFHLNASLEQVNNATVRQWQVTVGANGSRFYVTNLTRLEDLSVSGKVAHYALKWDQEITGWDYASGNPANARRLLLEVHAIVGNFIPAVLADTWIEARFVNRAGEEGVARYQDASGALKPVNESSGGYARPDPIPRRSPYLDFGGDWTRIGRLAWATNSTVDGTTQPLYAQVMGGWRVRAVGEAGQRFDGFVLLVGLSYAGGATIVHDPEVISDVQADLELPGSGPLGGAGVLLLVAAVAAAALVGLLLLLLVLRRRGGPRPP